MIASRRGSRLECFRVCNRRCINRGAVQQLFFFALGSLHFVFLFSLSFDIQRNFLRLSTYLNCVFPLPWYALLYCLLRRCYSFALTFFRFCRLSLLIFSPYLVLFYPFANRRPQCMSEYSLVELPSHTCTGHKILLRCGYSGLFFVVGKGIRAADVESFKCWPLLCSLRAPVRTPALVLNGRVIGVTKLYVHIYRYF